MNLSGTKKIVAGMIILCLASCRRPERDPSTPNDPTLTSHRLFRHGKVGSLVRLPKSFTNIDIQHEWHRPSGPHEDVKPFMSFGGVAIADYNDDGWLDVYITKSKGSNRLFRNLGGLRFADVSDETGLLDKNFCGTGATFVDIDNDGDQDLYACGYECPNKLYINDGTGKFEEKAEAFGLNFNGASLMVGFADYDMDGDLDGFLLTNRPTPRRPFKRVKRINGEWTIPVEDRDYRKIVFDTNGYPEIVNSGQPDILFRNDGKGADDQIKFSNVTHQAGIEFYERGQAFLWWDFNNDLAPDLFVINSKVEPSRLFQNNRDGTFVDVANELLTGGVSAISLDSSDANGDGWPDLLVAGNSKGALENEGLEVNERNGSRLADRNALVLNINRNYKSYQFLPSGSLWNNAIFADIDGDGQTDVFATGGMTRNWRDHQLLAETNELGGRTTESARQVWVRDLPIKAKNQLLRNLGKGQYVDVSKAWNMLHDCVGLGAAFGDLDNDGDLDLIATEFEGSVSIYRNDMNESNNIRLRLRGVESNRFGIGARVTIHTKNGVQTRSVFTNRGYMSSSDTTVHFGVGELSQIDKVEIFWPSGTVQVLHKLPANHIHFITEPVETLETTNLTEAPSTKM